MGWLDGWLGRKDPLDKLDPKLREFLDRESPAKQAKQIPAATPPERKDAGAPSHEKQKPAAAPVVPPQSLYQDGRYAHLWKTFRAQAEVEAEGKTDQEKVMDVLEGFKARKVELGQVALENCALEQLDWNNCMKSGGVSARLTMCRDEVRKFEKCYKMQTRLLKALGYLDTYERDPSRDEAIQMEADTRYQQLVKQEAALDKAKAEGRPVPTIPVLVTNKTPEVPASADVRKKWDQTLEKTPEGERAIELEALKAEQRMKAVIATTAQRAWMEQEKEREQRMAEGKATFADKLKSYFSGTTGK